MIGAAYAADIFVGNALDESARTFSGTSVQALDTVTRIGVLAVLLGLAWLVFQGPRSRIVGLAMVVVGGYVGLVPQLSIAFLVDTGIQLPPLVNELLSHSTSFVIWAATGVAVLGVIELLVPTRAVSQARVAPELRATV